MKCLVVDDSATMRRIIIKALKEFNFSKILEAKNGADAMTYVSEVDLILTDWIMPVMNGLNFVKNVRSQGNDVPILMITTNSDEDAVIDAIKEGISNYVIKPFTEQTLIKKVRFLLYKHDLI